MLEGLKKLMADNGIGKSYKSIFDLQGVPSYQTFYNVGILPWKAVYRGFYAPWHIINAPTIANPSATRRAAYLSTAKALCSEIAGIAWSDQCEVHVSMNGNTAEDDSLDDFVQDVLTRNNLQTKLRESVEKCAAIGGSALKVWHEIRRDDLGREIPGSGVIRIGYAMADQFVPIAWDNAEVTEGIFVTRTAKGGYYYTLLEWHTWDGTTYVIRNELYRAEQKNGAGQDQDILGIRYPLSEVYPFLNEETRINVEHSLFTYFRTPTANNIDDNSPLGISVYGNAMETLHAIDICFDSFVREFRLGKKRIIVPARMVRTVVDPASGKPVRYFDATDETYEALSTDDPDTLRIQDNSIELRVDEHVAGMNALLNILCLQVGLSVGTFSFDVHGGLKTATEVVSENSKTYSTIKGFHNQIAPALERLIDAIIAVAVLYDVQWQGRSVAQLAAGGYEVKIDLDDGVTQDRQTNINEGVTLVGAGLLSKFKFLTDPKYGQNLTEEEAQKELQRIAEESRVTLPQLDIRDYTGQEM